MFGLNRPRKYESSGSLSSILDIFHIFVNAKCSGLYWPPYLLTTVRICSNYTVWGYICILWPISVIAQRINRKKSASSIVSISLILISYWPTLLQAIAGTIATPYSRKWAPIQLLADSPSTSGGILAVVSRPTDPQQFLSVVGLSPTVSSRLHFCC